MPGTVSGSTLGTITSVSYACGGFAAMISDYLFGKTSNPARMVTNFADLRPGDVIYSKTINSGKGHAMVIIDTIENAPNRGFVVYIADGNRNDKVSWGEWPQSTTHWDAFTEDYFGIGQWVAYTRYPA